MSRINYKCISGCEVCAFRRTRSFIAEKKERYKYLMEYWQKLFEYSVGTI
jgi:2-iminoacetate synthase ThiH